MGHYARLDVLVVELGQPELLEDRAARLGRPPSHGQKLPVLAPAQAALESPVALMTK
jgi:hypothetical protein